MNFPEVVMACFDDKEFVKNWMRLRKIKTWTDKTRRLFIRDVANLVWDRIPKEGKP